MEADQHTEVPLCSDCRRSPSDVDITFSTPLRSPLHPARAGASDRLLVYREHCWHRRWAGSAWSHPGDCCPFRQTHALCPLLPFDEPKKPTVNAGVRPAPWHTRLPSTWLTALPLRLIRGCCPDAFGERAYVAQGCAHGQMALSAQTGYG